MARIDIDALQSALVALIAGDTTIAGLGFQARHIFQDGNDIEVNNINNMPLINVRLMSSEEEVVSIPDSSYEKITFGIDVYVIDFTSFREASRVRLAAARALKSLLASNRRFYSSMETSGASVATGFGQSPVEGSPTFVALATLQLVCEAYND